MHTIPVVSVDNIHFHLIGGCQQLDQVCVTDIRQIVESVSAIGDISLIDFIGSQIHIISVIRNMSLQNPKFVVFRCF